MTRSFCLPFHVSLVYAFRFRDNNRFIVNKIVQTPIDAVEPMGSVEATSGGSSSGQVVSELRSAHYTGNM